jgi:hypothetical protein
VGDPDLEAALGRSGRRNRVARVAVAGVALLTVAGVGLALLPGSPTQVPAVPAPAGTPSATAKVSPSVLSPEEREDVVRTVRADFRLPSDDAPLRSYDVVDTTLGAVAATSVVTIPQGADPSAAVWVVQVEGTFDCGPCLGSSPGTGPWMVLRAVVRQDDGAVIATGVSNQPAEFGVLGSPVTVKVPSREPGAPELIAQQGIKDGLASVEKVKLTHDQSVRTTLWRVRRGLFGETPSQPSFRDVWIAELTGSFTCRACTRLGDADHGTALYLVIDATSGAVLESVIAARPIDLGMLRGRSVVTWTPSVLR